MYFFFNTLYYLLKPGVVREHLALHSNCFSIAILHSNCFSIAILHSNCFSIAINFLTILDDFWHFEKSLEQTACFAQQLFLNCYINFLTILDDFWHFEKSCLKKVSLGLKNRF